MALERITCPRRTGEFGPWEHEDKLDSYSEFGECSFCGSLSPTVFFEAIERGEKIIPTDKNYKAYIRMTNSEAIDHYQAQIEQHIEHEKADGYVESSTDPFTLVKGNCSSAFPNPAAIRSYQAKVYFQHFSEDDKKRFVELLNAKKMNVVDGGFYRLPFFCVVKKAVA